MLIYKHRSFHQWATVEGISDETLRIAVEEIETGLHEGNLGSNLYKKRLALPGKGKRGSYRVLLAFLKGKKAFFIYGFAKNARANINENEQKIYRQLAKAFLNLDTETINTMIQQHKLFEVK